MSKFLLILISILTSTSWLKGQTYFLRTYDFGTVEYGYQLLNYNDRIFVNSATWCGTECSYLSEIDLNGNILWRTEVPDIDIAKATTIIVNDTITVTGNNDPFNTVFRMAHFNLNGERFGETIEIEHPTEKFTKMFQLTTQYYSDRYVICGAGKQGDIHRSLIYVVHKNGLLDTLIAIEPTSSESDLWDSFIDSQGRLTTFHWMKEDGGDINYRKIFKFNSQFDTVWSYRTEDNLLNWTVPRGCELQDGRTVLAYTNPIGGFSLHSVRAINPDGSLDWQYDYQWYGSREREILQLKTLKNGDLMGCGQYSEQEYNPRIIDAPWLFRMSPEGKLLWERTYYEYDSTLNQNGGSRIGNISDFIELDNGDIMTVGNFRYSDHDMLIMRVDSNGCLDPDNCSEVNIITSMYDLPALAASQILVYPNPVQELVYVKFDSRTYQLNINVLDMTGKIVAVGTMINGQGEICTSELNLGAYLINLKLNGRIIATGKFVKI